ncbi:MAG: long-chain fatty acid--CoA ligase [Armatimonadetes bacterium]|nr:long-chain fatty acid--CoA ligase [Armatimonadota bacterium]
MILFDLLQESAARNPDAPAICCGQTTTYGELSGAAEAFAGGLASIGIAKGARVALMLPNCLPFVISYLGAGRAGASVVPMNVLYRPDEAQHILEDSRAQALITVEPFRPLVQAIRPHLPNLKHVIMVGGDTQADELGFQAMCTHGPARCEPAANEDEAVILYTSGTTGRPNGAVLTHRNLIANAISCTGALPVSAEDCFLSALPLFHSFAAMVFLVLPVMVGSRAQLMERFMPATTLALMETSGATIFGGVPSMYGLMLQAASEARPNLSGLRICISGGAALPPEVCRAFEETFDTKVAEGYGLTEASPVVAVNPPFGVRKLGSIGPAVPGVEVKIVDDHEEAVEPGDVGELIVRGDNVMKGYLGKPEDTARVLRDGWLFTGDLAKMDKDGYLYIVGRKKELIIVGGLNVYPGEVERVLLEHPSVMEAAAFGVPDRSRGEAVWAAVVMRPGMSAGERELQAFCRERLASYKAPRSIIIRDELPKNMLGKVVRRQLREESLIPAEDPSNLEPLTSNQAAIGISESSVPGAT